MRIGVLFGILCFGLGISTAYADKSSILGDWVVNTVEEDPFNCTATVLETDQPNVFTANLICEDKCCDGNHAIVKQQAVISHVRGRYFVESEIIAFIKREEPKGGKYSPDNFDLTLQEDGTLIGFANGWTEVVWSRPHQGPLV